MLSLLQGGDFMKVKEMDKLIDHCNTYFEQSDPLVSHPVVDFGLHIDILLYKPNEKYPFWKLVTMGASDYKMPKAPNTVGVYNEYMMFVAEDVDLMDKETLNWYRNKLLMVATFACYNKTHITYAHSFEWENEDPGDEMIAAFIEFPQILETTAALRCKISLFKTVACLQVVLLNRQDLNKLMEIGPQRFSSFLYPEDDSKPHFLCEQHRTDNF